MVGDFLEGFLNPDGTATLRQQPGQQQLWQESNLEPLQPDVPLEPAEPVSSSQTSAMQRGVTVKADTTDTAVNPSLQPDNGERGPGLLAGAANLLKNRIFGPPKA